MDTSQHTRPVGVMVTAMVCAAVVMGQFVAGKAIRDALFLTSLDITALPAMLIATSLCSVLLVGLNSRLARMTAPALLVPWSFTVSGALFLVEWLARANAPTAAAVILYLHISAAGPLLTSGFWLISSERFDPRTAKKRFGQLAGAGTLGGLLSALVAERVATLFGAPAMLPMLAAIQFGAALLVRRLALGLNRAPQHPIDALEPGAATRSGLRVIAETPYLRHLAALVLLGTTGASLVDYLFKAQAVESFGRGDQLLRFFALYYAATSILTFIIQTSASRAVLERFGLGVTASTPSFALLFGSLGGLLVPGFGSLLVARGGESVFRSSLFRAGYELFYTPIPSEEKRAAKSLVDVAFDRLGDAIGGGLVRVAIVVLPAVQRPAILAMAVLCSLGALLAASRLHRGYVGTLASSLRHRAGEIDLALAGAGITRTLFSNLINRGARSAGRGSSRVSTTPSESTLGTLGQQDPVARDIQRLRSRDRERVAAVLGRDDGLPAVLVPHVIPLLAWDAVAEHAVFALQKVAEEHVGQFVDALMEPNQDFAVRRRLARVFSVCVSQRAADGAIVALDDLRFGVRCQAARSLAAMVEKNPRIQLDSERIMEVVLREVTVGRPVWEGRRMLDGFSTQSPLDAFVRDRAGESLAHVFTLLSLVLPREPLQLAFRGLHTSDLHLRGTALEYLDSVLPAQVRQRLWPFLEQAPQRRTTRPPEDLIAALLRSNKSIMLNLEELRRRSPDSPTATAV